jgi:stage II sporulation protein D
MYRLFRAQVIGPLVWLAALLVLLAILILNLTACGLAQPSKKEPGEPSKAGPPGGKGETAGAGETAADRWREEPMITLYMHETGEKREMPQEEYLLGVVAAEMDPQWPLAALEAQAILARTFTLEHIEALRTGLRRGADASTDVEEFQAYDAGRINEAVRQAVKNTRGQAVVWQGKLIKAWFFAEGGGRTAGSALEGLAYDKEETPYIHSVEDPGSAITEESNKHWFVSIPVAEAREGLKDFTGTDPGVIRAAEILERGESGRVTKVRLGGLVISGPAMRLALGSTGVKSALLTKLAVEKGRLVVEGKGYGHGVGMSQWGAKALAEAGKSGPEIIAYFFKDVEITQLYP